jgi:hypothetical protein
MLIRKLPKKPKRETRFRSQRHLAHVRSHACVVCDREAPIEAAHVRLGSGTGMGQKPHDYLAVALCGGPDGCHAWQHQMGEQSFWVRSGKDPHAIIDELIRTSPVRREIEEHRRGHRQD